MHRSIKIIIPTVVGCLAVAWAYAGTISGTASLTVVASGTPAPPTLNNPQIFSGGTHSYGGTNYTVDATGASDDWPALQAAMSAGDVDVKSGKYLLNLPTGSGGYTPPSGRNLYCENTTLPPIASTANVVFVVPTAPVNGWRLFYEWSNGEMYGCEFEGYHYPSTNWSGTDTNGNATDSVVMEFSGHDFNAYNNGFDGWPGSTAPFETNEASDAKFASGIWPYNIDISYNRFSYCNVRSVEADYGKNIQIRYNTMLDCPTKAEIQAWKWTGMTVLWDHNHITNNSPFPAGPIGAINVGADGGSVCISGISSSNNQADKYCPSYSSNCSASCPSDYHGNTFSNNTFDGDLSSDTIENVCCGNVAGAWIQPVYRNNTWNNVWNQINPPGNLNSNTWGAGSNQ